MLPSRAVKGGVGTNYLSVGERPTLLDGHGVLLLCVGGAYVSSSSTRVCKRFFIILSGLFCCLKIFHLLPNVCSVCVYFCFLQSVSCR